MKNFIRLLAMILVVVMAVATFAACNNNNKTPEETTPSTNNDPNAPVEDTTGHKDPKHYTYNTYTSLSPSNWNELTYQDNNDTQIMSYIGSSFFSFNFKFDEYGQIIPGEFVVDYSAATKLEDVTAAYAEAWGIDPEATGRVYKITLRDDLKWDDGTAITAADFIYTMKEQLNPDFLNYRADSFYASTTSIVGAKAYAKQGQSGWFMASEPYAVYSTDLDSVLIWTMGPAVADDSATTEDEARPTSYIRAKYFEPNVGMPKDYSLEQVASFLARNFGGNAETYIAMEGKTLAEIKADPTMAAHYAYVLGWWQTEPNEELHLFTTNYTFPEAAWEDVGLFQGDNALELVIVFEAPLDLLNDDGTLSYHASYDFSSLPLVHQGKYEDNKKAPQAGSELWTSTYNSSASTTASWGPYKLTFFQAGKQYVLERNEYWYGYNMELYKGQYQVDKIVCETIKEWNTAWVKFQAGEIDGIGIDVSIADEYKTSDRAYFTPDDYVGSLQLQSNKDALKGRESAGINKTLLTYSDFRKALSLAIDRADYTQKCTTSSLQGFGLFNSMHYYDVANGGVFRNTDEAKKVLCEVYGVDYTQYPTLDDAVDAITGYDPTAAKQLITSAYNAAIAAGDIQAGDTVHLVFGTGAINESTQRHFNYLSAAWTAAAVGTPLEGKLTFELKDYASAWANDFRAGAYDICMGGWTGAAWNPGYFLLAYLDEGYRYAKGWKPEEVDMTFTMVGVKDEEGNDITDTMNLIEWYECLNGYEDAKYDFSSNALEESQRLQLIAALEKQILLTYYVLPTYNSFGASLISFKLDYITYEYNTFMSYGGIRYATFNYDDEAWAAAVAEQNGQLNYK